MSGEPDIPAIAAALAAFVADPAPYLIKSDPPLDLRALAARVHLLPVVLDMGGYLGLRPTGAVASVAWDEPDRPAPVDDLRIRNLVHHRAGLRYPALADLAPARPPDARACPSCDGSGQPAGLPPHLAARIPCECGGLGWLPARPRRRGRR